MPTIIEVPASMMVPEHRHAFKVASPSWDHAMVSGEVNFSDIHTDAFWAVQGHEDDVTSMYEVHLKVGPWWKDVKVCVPTVNINGFKNLDADEDDEQEWIIRDLKWTTDGEGAPHAGEVRIRLEFQVGLRGENSWLQWLGYHFMAAGRSLGTGGVGSPGPIKDGP